MLFSIDIGPVTVPVYSLLALVGAAAMVLVVLRWPYVKAAPRQDVGYSLCYAFIGALVGAKLLYIISAFPEFVAYLRTEGLTLEFFSLLFGGGIVFYGGLLGGLLGVYIYARRYQVPLYSLLDAIAPGVPLFHCFGRLGCFAAGCCWGEETDLPIGVVLASSPFAPHVPLLPVQLFEAGGNLLLFIGLLLYTRRPRPDGLPTFLYLSLYAMLRFILEFFRGDELRGIFGPFSTSQWISLALLAVSLTWFIRHRLEIKKARENPGTCS
ncbi:MAG: prolipoprotein diacylglyceryl transferase [Coriobacteriales bacterium]|jgi:phosphatidylglycerol:prolipoprotein diacylglycerol transferase|nr:prolipoprotein diacylglyceryl transferase [Coriobacteriales bacterium]